MASKSDTKSPTTPMRDSEQMRSFCQIRRIEKINVSSGHLLSYHQSLDGGIWCLQFEIYINIRAVLSSVLISRTNPPSYPPTLQSSIDQTQFE